MKGGRMGGPKKMVATITPMKRGLKVAPVAT